MSDAGAAEFGARVYIPEYIAHVGDSNTLFGFSGNDTFVVNTNGSERFRINNSGFVGIGSNSPVAPLEVKSSEQNHLTLYRPTNTTEGIAGNINFDGNDSDTNQQTYAKISSFTDDSTAGSIAGKLSFSIAKGGDGMTSAMTIQKDAQVSLNQYGSGSYTGTAAYTSIEGQIGAGASVLMAIRKGWTTTPAVAVARNQDMVHRSVGRAGIVLTGGTSKMEGVTELAEEIFHMPVRIGAPSNVKGLSDIVSNPIYSTGVGLLHFGMEQQSKYGRGDLIQKQSGGVFTRLKNWFEGGV